MSRHSERSSFRLPSFQSFILFFIYLWSLFFDFVDGFCSISWRKIINSGITRFHWCFVVEDFDLTSYFSNHLFANISILLKFNDISLLGGNLLVFFVHFSSDFSHSYKVSPSHTIFLALRYLPICIHIFFLDCINPLMFLNHFLCFKSVSKVCMFLG